MSRTKTTALLCQAGEVSAIVESKVADDNFHLSLGTKFKCPKKQRVTFVPKQSHKSDVARLPKEGKGSSDIEWDDTLDDGYLTNLRWDLNLKIRTSKMGLTRSRLAIDAPR